MFEDMVVNIRAGYSKLDRWCSRRSKEQITRLDIAISLQNEALRLRVLFKTIHDKSIMCQDENYRFSVMVIDDAESINND
jgi:hypothetical protein